MIKKMRTLAWVAQLAAAALLLNGCASPPQHYYTLAQQPAASSGALQSLSDQREPIRIEVMPVRVPERLNRSNLILRSADGTLTLLEQDRWSATLPEELRDAMSQQLQTGLGAIDTYRQGGGASGRWYRIDIEVVQLDAEPGHNIDAVINWSVLPLPGGKIIYGRTTMQLPLPAQMARLVAGYQEVVHSSAADIAAAVRVAAADSMP
jgi:uncharacterized lipoprotein YmbA